MNNKADKEITFNNECANKVAHSLDADVLLINSDMMRGLDNRLIIEVAKRKRRKNVFLMLITQGGSPDAAYRIARCLQDYYNKFIVFITGYCKSAGTLCILGANEIVVSDMGELGPLDVQLAKKDDLFESSSGLVATEALDVLQIKSFNMFEEFMLAIKIHGGGQITFKTASEISLKLSVGLMEPLYRQIDPLQVGEVARSMRIATAYGQRLMLRGCNFNEETLRILRETYPSHGFVIDKNEIKDLFKNVREPSTDEDKLRKSLKKLAYKPNEEDSEAIMVFLSDAIKEKEDEKSTTKNENQGRIQKANRGASSGRIKKNS